MNAVAVCGDCRVLVLEAGGELLTGGEIGLGETCPTHPFMQATSAVVPPAGYVFASPADLTAAFGVVPWPDRMGTLTEASLRLLCSWSQGDPSRCDPGTIAMAVKAARELFTFTGGR